MKSGGARVTIALDCVADRNRGSGLDADGNVLAHSLIQSFSGVAGVCRSRNEHLDRIDLVRIG